MTLIRTLRWKHATVPRSPNSVKLLSQTSSGPICRRDYLKGNRSTLTLISSQRSGMLMSRHPFLPQLLSISPFATRIVRNPASAPSP